MIPSAASYNEFYLSPYQLQALGAPGYQGTELQAARVFVVAHRVGAQQLWPFFVLFFTRVLSKHSANRDPGGGPQGTAKTCMLTPRGSAFPILQWQVLILYKTW
jgi:hypothetical protein